MNLIIIFHLVGLINYTVSLSQNMFSNVSLLSKSGELVKALDVLKGKEVALYFAAAWCPMCRHFTPLLNQYYRNSGRKIELIFVSSDFSKQSALEHFNNDQGDWYSLQYEDALNDELKRKFLIWSGKESSKFGTGRRAGVPSIVLINENGEEVKFFTTERDGISALDEWSSMSNTCAWAG